MDQEFDIPVLGVKENKIEAFKELLTRYLSENNNYNNTAIFNGLYPALKAIHEQKSVSDVLKSIDSKISGFQFNWVILTLGDHTDCGTEIKDTWQRYQKTLEPKKKTRRSRQPEECLDE